MRESRIDPLRHVDVFDPGDFNPTRIDVIGCGATGSFLVLALARLGITNIHCWDPDTVAEHNIANQAYEQAHIGKPKVEALQELVERLGGCMTPHAEKCDGTQKFGSIVFLLTDTMASRKEIFEGSLKRKLKTKLVVETRMGADEGRLYAFSPMDGQHITEWEGTLYSDEEAEVSACGASTTVGATAMFLASSAVWTMMAFFKKREYDNEVIFGMTPLSFYGRKFGETFETEALEVMDAPVEGGATLDETETAGDGVFAPPPGDVPVELQMDINTQYVGQDGTPVPMDEAEEEAREEAPF